MANLTAFIPDHYLCAFPADDYFSGINAGFLSHFVITRHWADRTYLQAA